MTKYFLFKIFQKPLVGNSVENKNSKAKTVTETSKFCNFKTFITGAVLFTMLLVAILGLVSWNSVNLDG